MRLKIMTFNINGFVSEREEVYHWVNRVGPAMEVILKYDPDLLGCQELQTGNLTSFNTYLSGYKVYLGVKTVARDDIEKAMYNPVFWKTDRFEVYSSGSFYLSKTPEKWSKNWNSMHVRCANWVKLRSKKYGKEFMFLNTHLDHHCEQARIESSRTIVDQVKHTRLPVIIAGDFNSRAWAPDNENVNAYPPPIIPQSLPSAGTVICVYTDFGFKDTFIDAGHVNSLNTNTYHDFYGDLFPHVGLRIDWILTYSRNQRIITNKHLIIHDAKNKKYPSDHYPVMADVLIE